MIWQPDRPTVRSYGAVALRMGYSRTTDAWGACATAAAAVRSGALAWVYVKAHTG